MTRYLAIAAAFTVGAAIIIQEIVGAWVPAMAGARDWVSPMNVWCPNGAMQCPDGHFQTVLPIPAHFEPTYFHPSVLVQAGVAAVVTFLAIAVVRWAWRSFK